MSLAQIFLEQTTVPSVVTLIWCKANKIPLEARLGWDDVGEVGFPSSSPIRSAKVSVSGERFTFAPDGQDAFVVAEYIDRQAVDIIAFRSTWCASLCGLAPILGAAALDAVPHDQPIRVFRNGLEWLAGGRRGIAIVDASTAAYRLAGRILVADSEVHGLKLERALTLKPRVAFEVTEGATC